MAPASASLRGLADEVGFAPGWANVAGPGPAGACGSTGEYGGYCGCIRVCSYHSGALCWAPSPGGGDDQGNCAGGCWLPPSDPVPSGGVPSGLESAAGDDQADWDGGCGLVPSGG